MNENRRTTRRALLRAATVASGATLAGCAGVTTPADLASETEIAGNVGYFAGAPWLARHRSELAVIDARTPAAFRRERIHGTVLAPVDRLGDTRDTPAGAVANTTAYARAFASLGIAPSDDVVVYGASVGSRVTRVVYALHASGHRGDLHVLNGGLEAWNGRLATGPWGDPAVTTYDASPRPDAWVTRRWLAERVGTFNEGGPALLDVRPPEAYLGSPGADELDPSHERHGHLPGAINVHWFGNVSGRRLEDPSTLFGRYVDQAGVDPSGTVVVYGDGNVDATNTWVVLRALGFEDVRLYEGGFDEWSGADDRGAHPVETRTSVVVESEGQVGAGDDSGDFSCTG